MAVLANTAFTPASSLTLVPTLRVTAAERRLVRSYAERGNEFIATMPVRSTFQGVPTRPQLAQGI